jgi:hypothetical protein
MATNQSASLLVDRTASPLPASPSPAPELSPVGAVASAPGVRPFLQRRGPIGIILASFVLLTVPLTLMTLLHANETANFLFFRGYHITFSITHFFLTAWLYFDLRNLAYFSSSWRTRIVYYAVPLAILLSVWGLGFFHVDPVYGDYEPAGAGWGPMAYAFGFAFVVRALDYRHSTRQSFGVLQMIKVQPGAQFPAWSKAVDRTLFTALCLLELQTFASGGELTLTPLMIGSLIVTAGLLLAALVGFVHAWRKAPSGRVLLAPLTYFIFQTTAACLVVYRFELYAISLAMHFTEYHVLMAPRCFEPRPAAGTNGAPRRVFFLRRNWLAGYAVLIVLALIYYISDFMDFAGVQSQNQLLWAVTNMFNGIFLAHFFLESFVWKFSTPFYRTSLGSLFFPKPGSAGAPSAASAPAAA